MKYRKKPVIIEAITFDELVQHGLRETTNIVDGMPWSFDYRGFPITHENDECYLLSNATGVEKITKEYMLVTDENGYVFTQSSEEFHNNYEAI